MLHHLKIPHDAYYKHFLYLIFMVFILASCDTQHQSPTSSDQSVKLVTLAPHLTELVISAGAIDHLIGKTSYPGAVSLTSSEVDIVGDAFKLDYEKLLVLQPDYILSWKNGTPTPIIAQLNNLGFSVIEIDISHLEDIPNAIGTIAKLTQTEQTAQLMIEKFKQQLDAFKRDNKTKKTAFIQTYHQPLYTVSDEHWMSEAAAICGYQNIFTDLTVASASVSLESVISHNPEAIIIITNETTNNWQDFGELTAVKKNHIITLSPNEFSRPSMSLLKGIEKLCAFDD